MTLDFMVVSLPRSGSTWAANWLTTDAVHCRHDPLYSMHYMDFDKNLCENGFVNGIACTGIYHWPDWVNRHPARKVILHRDFDEIQQSMSDIGLPPLEHTAEAAIKSIEGLHVPYEALFDPREARKLWKYLTGSEFNERRHRELVDIEMQPNFIGLQINKDATRRLMIEIHEAMTGE